jgi:hypothetical protein
MIVFELWPKYTLTAIAGVIVGILAVHGQHGAQIHSIQVQVIEVRSSLQRIEDAVEKMSRRGKKED